MGNILEDLTVLLDGIGIPIETVTFTGKPPDRYIVLTPIYEDFDMYGDDLPMIDLHWARVSIFDKGNYIATKDMLVDLFIANEYYIMERTYVEYEESTKFHHYAIDVRKLYLRED